MTAFLFVLAALAIGFGLGYWVAHHPDETRTFGEQLGAKLKGLFARAEKKIEGEPPK